MNTIDRISGQDAARTYVQNVEAGRTSSGPAITRHAAKADHSGAPKADSVTLSDNARSLAAAREAVKNAPDVRQEKVAEIKQQVDSGTYQVSARVLARKMVDASNSQA
jgi:negative regulator of flagellin synthesis FlgM